MPLFGHRNPRGEMGRTSSPGADGRPSGGGKAGQVLLAVQSPSPFYCLGVSRPWELSGTCGGTVGSAVLPASGGIH